MIEGWAFQKCSSLVSIFIPSNVKVIGRYAFRDCTWLVSVILPVHATHICETAFKNCSHLSMAVAPRGIGVISVDDHNQNVDGGSLDNVLKDALVCKDRITIVLPLLRLDRRQEVWNFGHR